MEQIILHSPVIWVFVAIMALVGSLHILRIISQVLVLVILELRVEWEGFRYAVIRLRNELTLTVDTTNTESVGEFIDAVRHTGPDPAADSQRKDGE